MIRLLPLLALFAIGTAAHAAPGCVRATTPIDKAVCGTPALVVADRTLNATYARVRTAVAPSARPALLRQQRAWLADRDARCRDAAPACLAASYRRRNLELAAIAATADASDDPIADVTPVLLTGTWKVTGLADPAGQRVDPAVVAGHLVDAGLPALGTIVTAGPGRLCIVGNPCEPFGWSATTLAGVEFGPALQRRFGLAASSRAYTGTTGGKRSFILLVPRAPRDLAAAFILCDKGDADCRVALELWQPASADAAISPRP